MTCKSDMSGSLSSILDSGLVVVVLVLVVLVVALDKYLENCLTSGCLFGAGISISDGC